MKKIFGCALYIGTQICISAYGIPSAAQAASAASTQSLSVTEIRKVPMQGALVGSAHCDQAGNMYFRVMDTDSSNRPHATLRLGIRKMTRSGSFGSLFEMPDDPSDLLASDFFVTSEGSVYLASRRLADQGAYVVRFAPNGDRTLVALELQKFIPRQIVVFSSGEMLVSGTNGLLNHTPFTGLFASDGKLLRKIYEPEDEEARLKADANDSGYVYEGSDNMAVVHGDAVLGSDGNAYLLRAVAPALIYVISSKGEVLRKLRLESPAPELLAQGLRSGKGKLAVSFLEPYSTRGRVKLVDLGGNVLSELVSNEKATNFGLPACYDGESFSVLHVDENSDITFRRVVVK